AKNLLLVTAAKQPPKIQKNVFVPEIEQGVLRRIYYAQTLKGSLMRGVIVQEFVGGRLAQIVNAEEAAWQQDKNQWLFRNGTIYFIAESGEYKHLVRFKEQYVTMKYTPADFYVGDQNPDEMNFRQLQQYIVLKEKMGVEVTDFKIQLNLKLAIPFASLVFALLGAPLGLSPRRASGSIGLGISIIVIFFYYLTAFFSIALGEMKVIPPGVSAWLPNFATGAIGFYILKQAAEK
ncbi:MAG: LptF/LptG family permease, partial [Candidatus Margulisiibacteriota bacterium]